MSARGENEAGPFAGDLETRIDLVMTSYRTSPVRQELFVRSLRSLAKHTDVDARLWLMDDSGDREMPDVAGILSASRVELAAVCRSGMRIGQAAQFNRAFAMIDDDLRQTAWPFRCYIVKIEDDFAFKPRWLRTLVSVWHAPEFAGHNIGMLGGANGEDGPLVKIGGHDVRLTIHVAAGCMFAPVELWRQYLPVPPRDRDRRGGEPPCAAEVDWHVSRMGLRSVLATGRRCGLLDGLIEHIGGGQSTWRT